MLLVQNKRLSKVLLPGVFHFWESTGRNDFGSVCVCVCVGGGKVEVEKDPITPTVAERCLSGDVAPS